MKITSSFLFLFFLCITSISSQSIYQIVQKIQNLQTQNCSYNLQFKESKNVVEEKIQLKDTTIYLNGEITSYFLNITDRKNQFLNGDQDEFIIQLELFLEDYKKEVTNTNDDFIQLIYTNKNEEITSTIELVIPHSIEYLIEVHIFKDQRLLNVIGDPSFEDYHFPYPSSTPSKWKDCSVRYFPEESPPDIHSAESHRFGNNYPPSDGKQYMSLVTRENQTWEMIGQEFNYPLTTGYCYGFQIDVRTSLSFRSGISNDKEKGAVPFTTPIQLKISLSHELCNIDQEIFISKRITHDSWETLNIEFLPDAKYQYILFEAFDDSEELKNGNLMIDNIRNFDMVKCDEK